MLIIRYMKTMPWIHYQNNRIFWCFFDSAEAKSKWKKKTIKKGFFLSNSCIFGNLKTQESMYEMLEKKFPSRNTCDSIMSSDSFHKHICYLWCPVIDVISYEMCSFQTGYRRRDWEIAASQPMIWIAPPARINCIDLGKFIRSLNL